VYECESWTPKKADEKRIIAFEMKGFGKFWRCHELKRPCYNHSESETATSADHAKFLSSLAIVKLFLKFLHPVPNIEWFVIVRGTSHPSKIHKNSWTLFRE